MSRKRGQEKEVILTISDFIVEELFFIGFKRSKVLKKKMQIYMHQGNTPKQSLQSCMFVAFHKFSFS